MVVIRLKSWLASDARRARAQESGGKMDTRASLFVVTCVMAGLGLLSSPGCSGPIEDGSPEVGIPSGAGNPTGVTLHWETLQRKGTRGDNWCMTWAADDNVYTMMDDGIGWNEDGVEWGTKFLQMNGRVW